MIKTNNNGYSDNPFGHPQYDFYDEIVCTDAKRDFSRFFNGLFVFNIISYAAVLIITLALLLIFGKDGANEILSNVYFDMIFGVLPMYLIALPVLYLMIRKMPERRPERQDFGVKTFIGLFPVCILFMTLGNYIGIYLNVIIGAIRGYEVPNGTAELVESSPVWLTVIMVVILAPLAEEFIFRKLMIGRLSRYGYGTAILVSSLTFGLFHGNLYQFFYATFVGIILGYIFVKSGNWLLSALMHALLNLYGSVISVKMSDVTIRYLELYEQYVADTLTDMTEFTRISIIAQIISLFQIALLITGAVIFFRSVKRRSFVIADLEGIRIPKGRRAKTIFLNIGAILFLVSSLLIFLINL